MLCGTARGHAAVTLCAAITTSLMQSCEGKCVMLQRPKCPVIALEEHYWDKELAAQFVGAEGVRDPEMLKRLYDLGELRLKEMDEAGIDVQILSHGAPSAQKLSGVEAVYVTRRANDRLPVVVAPKPARFSPFTALLTT